MTITSIPEPSHRMWTAMLASLASCYGCRIALNNTAASMDGFCRDCLERSRCANGDDELGGEA